MATNFPTNIDTFTDQTSSDLITSAKWNNLQDSIEALEVKVGADNSTVTTSHDYKLTELATTLGLAQTNIASLQNVGKIKARAYRNAAQNIDAKGYTKVAIDTVSFDTESVADVTTNNRITPTLPGYYHVTGNVFAFGVPDGERVTALIYKNGFRASVGSHGQPQGETGYSISITSDLIYMNGTTDYLELYAFNSHWSAPALYVDGPTSAYNYLSVLGPF